VKKLELEVDRHIGNFMRELEPPDLNRSFKQPMEGRSKKVLTWNLKGMLWHLI